MRERDNMCNYIDIPLQHVNSRILKSMRRGVNATQTQQIIDRFRTELPDAAIRTSFIVGYPGETQEEMEELLNFISHNRFDRVGVFTYSHEEDTHAFQLPDDVPEDEKNERAANLMKLQEQIAFELNQKLEGKSLEVIIDRLEGDYWIGRTQYDSPEVDNEVLVDMNTHPNLKPGELYRMTIDSVDQFDLFATPISDDPI
jgi:ribosomal protein S12 methylthiotransferase